MEEGRIADEGDDVLVAGLGGPDGHPDGGTHADEGLRDIEGRQGPEGVAADVGEDGRQGKALDGLRDRRVAVRVGTALAELGRTVGQGRHVELSARPRRKGQGGAHVVGIELARAR